MTEKERRLVETLRLMLVSVLNTIDLILDEEPSEAQKETSGQIRLETFGPTINAENQIQFHDDGSITVPD